MYVAAVSLLCTWCQISSLPSGCNNVTGQDARKLSARATVFYFLSTRATVFDVSAWAARPKSTLTDLRQNPKIIKQKQHVKYQDIRVNMYAPVNNQQIIANSDIHSQCMSQLFPCSARGVADLRQNLKKNNQN